MKGMRERSALTYNMQIAKLGLGRHRVNLAHVAALVLLLDIGNVQEPCFVFVVLVVGHTDPWIACDDVIVHGQDGRLLEMHPRHLEDGGKETKRKPKLAVSQMVCK
jgi:hypothetical protein